MSKTPQKKIFICFKLETLVSMVSVGSYSQSNTQQFASNVEIKFFRGHKRFTRISQLSFNLQIGHIERIIFIEARQIPP